MAQDGAVRVFPLDVGACFHKRLDDIGGLQHLVANGLGVLQRVVRACAGWSGSLLPCAP
jgi:hypothetical protein